MDIHFTTRAYGIPDVTDLATRKSLGLEKYLKNSSTAQLYVDLLKDSEAHRNGDIWSVQVNLDDNGRRYHASAHAEKIESAVAKAMREVGTEVRRMKRLDQRSMKRNAGVLKQQMLGFGF